MKQKITNQKTNKNYAEYYHSLGFAITPVRGKKGYLKEFEQTTVNDYDPILFPDEVNIGFVLGKTNNNLIDIDLIVTKQLKHQNFFRKHL